MGLLSRPDWRRIQRSYEIRRDLEHEDDEYEATFEDCVYIFGTIIGAILSKDPVHVIKVTEVKDIIEQAVPCTASATLMADYESAPAPRQLAIVKFLISTIRDIAKADIVRQNSINIMRSLALHTHKRVTLDIAQRFTEDLGRKPLSFSEARIACAAGITPYLKQVTLRDFYGAFLGSMEATGYSFKNHEKHGELLRNFSEIGRLTYVPEGLVYGYTEWLILCFIGEESYGRGADFRSVFYSNVAAPECLEILRLEPQKVRAVIGEIESKSKAVKYARSNEHVEKRYQQILDAIAL